MSPEEALQLILDKLEGCGIDHMLTGSFASNMHGVPRTTEGLGLELNEKKYPVEKAKGSAKKYTET